MRLTIHLFANSESLAKFAVVLGGGNVSNISRRHPLTDCGRHFELRQDHPLRPLHFPAPRPFPRVLLLLLQGLPRFCLLSSLPPSQRDWERFCPAALLARVCGLMLNWGSNSNKCRIFQTSAPSVAAKPLSAPCTSRFVEGESLEIRKEFVTFCLYPLPLRVSIFPEDFPS